MSPQFLTIVSLLFVLFVATNAWVIGPKKGFSDRAESFSSASQQKRVMHEFASSYILDDGLIVSAVNQSIPDFAYFIYPDLENSINDYVYGAFDGELNDDIAITGFEGFASLPDVYPLFVSYSGVKSGKLNKVDTVYQNASWGSAAASVCKNKNKRFVVEALLKAKNPLENPFVSPVDALVVLWEYYPNGTWFSAPTTIYNLSVAEPTLYQSAASYSGSAALSEDCEYLIYTAALGDVPFPFTPLSQVVGLLKINANYSFTKVASIPFPNTNIAGYSTNPPTPAIFPVGDYLYFAQTAHMSVNKKGIYSLVVPAPTYTLFDIQGTINGTASLFSYSFKPLLNQLTQVSQLPLPQYPQGLAVSNNRKTVVVVSDCVTFNNPSFSKRCKNPYANSSPKPDDEVRFYELDKDSSLEYSDSFDLNGWGVNAAFSPKDDKLAITWAPVLLNTLINFTSLSFSSSVVTVYDYKGGKLRNAVSAGTSPLSFGLAFSEDKTLFVAGMPMLVQSDVQLIKVD